VALDIVFTSVVLAADIARKGDCRMRLFVALQVVLARESLRTRDRVLALFEVGRYILRRTKVP
jgi:hypothetical protein